MAGPHALFRESVLDSGQNESCVSGILVLSSVSPCLYTLEQATSLSLCSLRVWASAPLCMAGAQAWGLGRSSVADLSHLGWDHLRAFLSLCPLGSAAYGPVPYMAHGSVSCSSLYHVCFVPGKCLQVGERQGLRSLPLGLQV